MKKLLLIILSIFALLGLGTTIITVIEPYYINEVYQNIIGYSDFKTFEKALGLKEQVFSLGNINITEDNSNSYIIIPKDYLVKNNQLTISVTTGRLSYNIFGYNSGFVSRISPAKMQYIDNYSHLGKGIDSFNCLKILAPGFEVSTGEKCKYITITYLDYYPELKLDISSSSGTVINIQ